MSIYPALLSAALILFSAQSHAISRADIAEVINIDVDRTACGLVDAVMTYKTPSGEIKEYKFQELGDGCSGG